MAQLVVRNLDESVKAGLRERASRHGRSMEAEIREILRAASLAEVSASEPLNKRLARRFAGLSLSAEDVKIPELRGQAPRSVDFE
jgi:plasmid stability protein